MAHHIKRVGNGACKYVLFRYCLMFFPKVFYVGKDHFILKVFQESFDQCLEQEIGICWLRLKKMFDILQQSLK
jgi:hypothetical protein